MTERRNEQDGEDPAIFPSGAPELILTNARVLPCDPNHTVASEVAIGRGRVLKVGHGLAREHPLAKGAEVLDCRGGAVLPGFIDAHLHFFSYADSLLSLNLRPSAGVRSISRLQEVLRREADTVPPGQWLKGKGYNDFYLYERRHPTRWDLDAAVPGHPVKLTHRSHHAHVLNSAALAWVGIGRETEDPPGGLIERDPETGEPTGVLFEMGRTLAERIPPWPAPDFERGIERAARELAANGITAFLDASPNAGASRQGRFHEYKARGLIPQRVVTMLGREALEGLAPRPGAQRAGDEVSVWGIKVILDRTTGSLRPTQRELNKILRDAQERGWPVAVHAVEEETLEAALDAFETAGASSRPNPGHRIEHGSVCTPRLARRMAALGVTVTTQPSFLYFHGERYLKAVDPKTLPHLYPLATWLRSGVPVAGSSDAPIVPPSPLLGIYAAVTRQAKNGEVVGRKQRVSTLEAVEMYTTGAARAIGLDPSAGRLVPGGRADLVVLSRDPFSTPPDELKDIRVRLTLIAGEVAWRHE